jgi:AraC family transcriptional regulator
VIDPDRFENGHPMLLAGLRRRHGFATMRESISRQWADFQPLLGGIAGRVGTDFYGAMCGADNDGIEYLSGVQVASFEGLDAPIGRVRVPAQHYAVFTHQGSAATVHTTWQRIMDWLPTSGCVSAQQPDFERYSAGYDPLAPEGRLEIWVGVLRKP